MAHSNPIIQNIRSRRVCRAMSDEPIAKQQLIDILDAGRWAPAGGNLRVVNFVAVDDPELVRLLRMISPGMQQTPQAIILLYIDWSLAEEEKLSATDMVPYIDIGTTMQTMMLAAHALGLGAGPVTSFSKAAVKVVLNMPTRVSPEMMITIGHRAKVKQIVMRSGKRTTWETLTTWGRFNNDENG